MSNDPLARERRVRRLAHRKGYQLWKVRERSRSWPEYAPFSLVQLDTNSIHHRGGSLDDIEEFFRS